MITIVCIGKVKDKDLASLANQYLDRLKRYVKLEVINLRDHNDRQKDSETMVACLEKRKGFKILLSERGLQKTSIEFSRKLDRHEDIVFIFGGPDGLAKDVEDACDSVLALSRMTFTHEAALVILLEQIYRGFKIKNDERYHRE